MNWILLALWGGAVGLDGTSVIQAMISRPIVAALVTGMIVGHPAEALMIGVTLEIFSLVILPIGAARYPESGVGAVVAVASYPVSVGVTSPVGGLFLAIFFGLVWEQLAGGSVTLLRRLNAVILTDMPTRSTRRSRSLERRHLSAIGIDGLRAVGLVLLGAATGRWLLGALGPLWWLPDDVTSGILVVAVTTVLGATITIFGGWTRRKLVAILGVLCGFMILQLL